LRVAVPVIDLVPAARRDCEGEALMSEAIA